MSVPVSHMRRRRPQKRLKAKAKEEAKAETAQKVAETTRLHAKGMKELGVDYQVISNIIGLSLDEIEAL